MAGGPHAAIMMCLSCLGPADRIGEGIEDDMYQCRECGSRFGIDWRRGQPERPCWPPTAEELELAKAILATRKAKGSG
jgi:hypothetical protein